MYSTDIIFLAHLEKRTEIHFNCSIYLFIKKIIFNLK